MEAFMMHDEIYGGGKTNSESQNLETDTQVILYNFCHSIYFNVYFYQEYL